MSSKAVNRWFSSTTLMSYTAATIAILNCGSAQLASAATPNSPDDSGSGSVYLEVSSLTVTPQTLGTIGSPRNFKVVNQSGSTVSLSISLSGRDADEFSTFDTCNSTLLTSASCEIDVEFSPTRIGTQSVTITVTDNLSGTHAVTVSGVGVLPGEFEIVNSATTKVLEVSDSYDGSILRQNTMSGSVAQSWRLTVSPDGFYQIVNSSSGKALDVIGGSVVDGALVQQYASLGSANQQWQFVFVDAVHFKIVNKGSGKVLDLPGGSVQDGAYIQQWGFNGSPQQLWTVIPTIGHKIISRSGYKSLTAVGNDSGFPAQQGTYIAAAGQQWQLLPVDAGYYAVVNRRNGKVLDVTAASKENGAIVQQYDYHGGANQQWRVVAIDTTDDKKIINRLSGKALDVTGSSTLDGALLQQWDYYGSNNQRWSVNPIPYFRISNVLSGKMLDLPGGATADGVPIQQWSSNNQAQQTWELVSVGYSGDYAIINKASGKALEVTGSSKSNGAIVQQSQYVGADNQLWQLRQLFDSNYWITNKLSGKVLDNTGNSTKDGTLIQQYDLINGYNQRWLIR